MEIKYTTNSINKRLLALFLLVVFFLCLLVGRLLFLQVLNGPTLAERAHEQWLRDLPLTASRGNILDRNGAVIASSYTTYDLYVRHNDIKDEIKVTNVIAKATKLDFDEVYKKVSKTGFSEVKVVSGVERTVVQEILSDYQEGIFFVENTKRLYNYGNLLTQVLGFVSSDGNGQGGLEQEYNKYLKGVNGSSLVESDLRGVSLDNSLCYFLPSVDGLSLKLTIDLQIQLKLEEIIEQAVNQNGAKSASSIVMNPKTGEILAITTKPSYNLNEVPRDDIETLLKLSRATTILDSYEPGSTFKIITTAIALNEGLTNINDYFYCGGFRMVNGVKINCHRRTGHGSQSLTKGLMNSCNCVFMELIRRIGLEKFYKYLELFGISTGYNLDFPAEGKGVLMPKGLVTDGDLFRMGFGQSIALTPLNLITSVCACINGGHLLKPHFVTEILDSKNNSIYKAESAKIRTLLKPNVSTQLNKMLYEVVSSGGGKHAKIEGYDIAGKTGTAQKYEDNKIAQGKYVASFMGYYPSDSPDYAVLVLIDEPKGAYYGGVVAAPVAKQVFESIFDLKETPKNENLKEEEKLEEANIVLPDLTGKTLTEAVKIISSLGLQYLTSGEGKFVKDQIAAPNSKVSEGDIVLLIF